MVKIVVSFASEYKATKSLKRVGMLMCTNPSLRSAADRILTDLLKR